jgi:predicted nucleic acid-binding protein
LVAYIDTSILLEEIFKHGRYARLLNRITDAYASELLVIEGMRTIDRYRVEGKLRDDELARAKQYLNQYTSSMNIVELHADIKKRAAMPFATVVGTLDALHLGTALYLNNQVNISITMVTLDRQLAIASMAENIPLADELS